ncbi:MAG: HAMP domain-containing histidine kinase [Clostridia bacterium]|nr:HAMP domain-containing histidine kinase [Clostridia bacterium]
MNKSEKKLRRRFVRIAMGSLVVVIILLAVEFYFVGIVSVFSQKDALLDFIAENDGVIPAYSEEQTGRGVREFRITPETRFESRFFSATFDRSGHIQGVNNDNIASVSEEDAYNIAFQIINRKKTVSRLYFYNDYIDCFRYQLYSRPDGGTLMVCVDVTSEWLTMARVFAYSASIMLCLVVLFFIVINLFAGAAVRPFVRNRTRQSEFITNASHELKTPLAVISANNEMTEMLSGKTEWTESTSRQVERMTGLIGDLIIMSRLDEKTEMAKDKVNFSAVITDLSQSFNTVAAGQGKTLASEIGEGINVLGEERFIRSMASALIENAVKYCDDGGSIRVELSADKRAVFKVSNSYADGASLDCGKLFNRFYRADESHNSSKKGYGIGLSMAQSVVEKSGGTIGADWKDGVITFTVKLKKVTGNR